MSPYYKPNEKWLDKNRKLVCTRTDASCPRSRRGWRSMGKTRCSGCNCCLLYVYSVTVQYPSPVPYVKRRTD